MILKTNILKFNNTNPARLFLSTFNTVDNKEIQHFQRFAAEWWDPYGPMKPLHSMNKLRIPLVRDGLINTGTIEKEKINSPQPLRGISILDVGCGGGILSEPLARLGGNVTGLDANPDIIELAKCHSKQENLNISYEAGSIEDHSCKNTEKYDAVVASEVLEHVTQKDEFLKACLTCLKPTGSIFITTMSNTTLANVVGIQLAENVLKLLPKGTHQIEKFIKPHEVQKKLEDNGCRTELIHGMVYVFFLNTWIWCPDTSINYALHAKKLSYLI